MNAWLVLGAVVDAQDRPGEAAAAPLGSGQGVGDDTGAHVIGQYQPARRHEAKSTTVAR
ncbi:hypothetical protein [Streptomyces leeuwenhoekii]|uniref:hypothetical protein n=1 Tax=Streptomyces leeuwenhoekii TaxID=1437453 RepID=UPI00131C1811|nr:hypothetical protein [Streptomyces leeuwenhoekii]